MSSNLAAYLAKNYLNADPPSNSKPKKKKRKHESSSGLIIADDDAPTWSATNANSDTEDTPIIAGTSTSFRKAKKSNWILANTNETAEADAIIASNRDNSKPADDVEALPDPGVVKMESGAHAGLQTAAQVSAQLAAAKRKEEARFAAMDPSVTGMGQETIYRDASGRIINIAMARAEARKKAEEEEEKVARVREMQKGEVQKIEEEERRKKLQEAKYMTLARYRDDEEMNREMKEEERWADPALAFLTKRKDGARSKTGRKTYQGAAPPNRFGIRPGHRWDGVDRGNGFEKKWFLAQNKLKEKKELQYTSMMDID
ncbi:hypothetical protein EX30DRAFT_328512 [Ascodesmis nigricans]|uniref:Pre-mRNA-splicing factor CWC26 n=1 Tax=Ascodesmis nigricans TaxID=341454 RepID=A0A4S2N195_9PEZI|nr:hypothetical protein EX30DRAFT_328512 [Ascodesmis nigricans]